MIVVVVMVVMGVHTTPCGGPRGGRSIGAMGMVLSAEEWHSTIIYRIIDGTTLKAPIPPLPTRLYGGQSCAQGPYRHQAAVIEPAV